MKNAQDPSSLAAYRYHFGTAAFDEARYELCVAGAPVEVELRALEVLAYLLRHAGKTVTKAELLREVWAGRITVEKVLANAISKLRRALGASNANFLLTKPCIGYRFEGTVKRIAIGRKLLPAKTDLARGTLAWNPQCVGTRKSSMRPAFSEAPVGERSKGRIDAGKAEKATAPNNARSVALEELQIGLKALVSVMSRHQPEMTRVFVKDLRRRAAAASIDCRFGFLGEVIQVATMDVSAAISTDAHCHQ